MERKLKTREGKMIKSMYCAWMAQYRARTKVKPTNEWMGCCVGTYLFLLKARNVSQNVVLLTMRSQCWKPSRWYRQEMFWEE